MIDPTAQKLSTLEEETQLRAYLLVKAARESGIPLMIISGLRSFDLNAAVGGAVHSLHLQGRAFDVQVAGYAVADLPQSFWVMMGNWAEQNLGLRWGGRFATPDLNHFDL